MNNNDFHIVNLAAYQTPEIIEDVNEDFISWGDNNDFYSELIDVYLNSPTSHSIISDMYPKEERASALGVYSMGIPLGVMAAYFATASLMGTSNDDVNWRQVFIFLGLTGIALAVIVKLVIREPARGAMEFEGHTEIA